MTEVAPVDLEVEANVDQRVDALRDLFPEAFTDGSLDLSKIGQTLGLSVDPAGDRYGLSWAGKADSQGALAVGSIGTLRPNLDESLAYDTARNVFIEGDNLEALRLLQRGYNDQYRLIYIDPPYNTGGDLIYDDDFRDGLSNYLDKSRQVDGAGNLLKTNPETSGRVHSDWLSMMYPRLSLARNLLTQDGLILVSINDVEVHNLRHLLDEAFGASNYLATFVWNNDGNIEQQSAIKANHEYIVAYARNKAEFRAPRVVDPNIAETSKLFNEESSNTITKNGPANPASEVTLPAGFPCTFESGTIEPRTTEWPHIFDEVEVKDGVLVSPVRMFSGWSSKRLLEQFIDNDGVPIADAEGKETSFAVTKTGAIYVYKVRSEAQHHVLTVLRNMGTTQKQSALLAAELGLKFSFPKPEFLIEYLVSAFTAADDRVLDFFAGSGTTGAAVLRANKKDGGHRRFTLVQIDQPIDEAEMLAKGYASISDMTIARVRAAVTQLAPDAGLRVLKLASSNFKVWNSSHAPAEPAALGEQLALYANSLAEDATDDGIALEVLLKHGLPLDLSLSRTEIAGSDIVVAGDNQIAVSLAREFDTDLIGGLVDLGVPQIVMLESAFADNDGAKSNAFFRFQDANITMRTV